MAIREIEVNTPHQNLQFKDHAYAHQLLDNLEGIELGPSSHNSFHLPGSKACAPKDNFDFYKIEGQAKFNGKYCEIDLWGEAAAIPVADNSQGYVISSHVIEHIPDLIRAFQEWDRILVDGGYIFIIAPQRDALEADKGRELSDLTGVLTAYEFEWTPNTVPEAIDKAAGGWRGHYWVFTMQSFIEIINGLNERGYINWELIHTEDPDQKVGNGFNVVYKTHKKITPIETPTQELVADAEPEPEPIKEMDFPEPDQLPEPAAPKTRTRKKKEPVLAQRYE